MTNKRKTISACRQLIKKYENVNKNTSFFKHAECPLCDIHYIWLDNCKGCPLANRNGTIGCPSFKTSRRVLELTEGFISSRRVINDELKKACQARADFFKKIIPILENIKEERFTKEGWKYFNELNRNW